MTPPRRIGEKNALRADASGEEETGHPWRAWLRLLGRDAPSALAASFAYALLDDADRDAWLDALEEDLADVSDETARNAAYAPLLANEENEARRARILANVGAAAIANHPPRAWIAEEGARTIVVVTRPLVFSFVEAVACAFDAHHGVTWARHLGLTTDAEARALPFEISASCTLLETDVADAIDIIAHAVLAHGRVHGEAPESLAECAHFFAASEAFS